MPGGLDGSPLFFLAAASAAIMVGLAKGGLPVIGMLGVPILALMIPPLAAAALLLPIYVVSDMVGIYLYRRLFSLRNLLILAPASAAGIALGWATASLVSERWVTLLVGSIGLIYCVDTFRKRGREIAPRPADLPRGAFCGLLTGFTSFVSHSGAPPFQMYVLPQKLPKLVFAGTSTLFFAFVNAVKLIPYWALGQFSADNLGVAAWLVPVAVAATFAGAWLTRRLPERAFFTFVQAALFLVSLKLVFDGLSG